MFCTLLNCRLVVLSNTKMLLFGNYFLKCNKVKRILISFNCFSEYSSIHSVAQFQFQLWARKVTDIQSFISSDVNEFRTLIIWLEDQKIRHYKIEDRAGLRNIANDAWPKAFEAVSCVLITFT